MKMVNATLSNACREMLQESRIWEIHTSGSTRTEERGMPPPSVTLPSSALIDFIHEEQ